MTMHLAVGAFDGLPFVVYGDPSDHILVINEINIIRKGVIQRHIYENTRISEHTTFHRVLIRFDWNSQSTGYLAQAVKPPVFEV